MSLRARIFCWIIKRQVGRTTHGDFDLVAMRQTFEQAPSSLPKGVVATPGRVGDVDGEWVRRREGGDARRLLYIHGGGFVACSARTHRAITGGFARRGFAVFAPNYRLAPEHPFPAALDDLLSVWRDLASAGAVGVAGDSAGATLALALTLRARAAALPLPRALVLFSPATDLLGKSPSLTTNAHRDPMLNADALRTLIPLYLGEEDPGQPLASPLYADLAGFPPMLIHVGEREILRDDGVRLADRARAAGVPVVLKVYPIVPHVWQIAQAFLPEARESLETAAVFLKTHLEAATG